MLPASSKNTQIAARARVAGEAAQVRALAGTSYSRRGSVLVLVVGVLALLAIIVVVYTSVGQADVRGGRALVNKARLDDQSRAFADYITRVVGEDASATKIQQVSLPNGATAFLSVREGMDYPYTSPNARADLTRVPVPERDYARFEPVGNITKVFNGLDPRTPSDPYLSSTEPTWINNGFAQLQSLPTPGLLLAHQRDWAHMSIIAPSGLPVNLANLRGNFNAPSGYPQRPYATSGQLMMNDWLHVWRASSATSNYYAQSDARQVATATDYNSPATFSNDCTDTFRPVTWNPGNKLVLGDVKFMGNQLGDADGDGFYDSRWQELVDISDPANPINLLPGGTGGGLRWFVAPRIIDLSSMVNVNTATSFAVAPDAENPAGLTPSDIDLERLLTAADVRQYFGISPTRDLVGGSNALWAGSSPLDFTNAGRWAFAGILESRATGMTEVVDNAYVDAAGTSLASPAWLFDMGVARGAGGQPALGSVTRKLLYTTAGKDESAGQLRSPAGTNANYFLKQASGFGLADELELRRYNGLNDPTTRSRLEAVAQPIGALAMLSPFRSERDLATEREAGIRFGIDATIDGVAVPRAMAQHFFDVRHLLTTLSGSRPFGFSSSFINNPTAPTTTAARPLTESELRIDVTPLIEKALSNTPQGTNNTRMIFPLSSANTIFQNYATALSPFLGAVDPLGPSHTNSEALWAPAASGQSQRALALSFGGVSYDTATSGTQVGETVAPLFTGRAAEIAVRTAAHMAINLLAARDNTQITANANNPPDNRPLAATVLLDENRRADVANGLNADNSKRFPYWRAGTARLGTNDTTSMAAPGTTATDVKAYTFDLNGGQPGTVQRLANGSPATYPYAVNVFAAQPQPFLTAAVIFDMYYDAPGSAGGDSRASGPSDNQGEWYVSNPGDPANNIPPTVESLGITIKGAVDSNNPDFLMEAIAFQVTNPFDVPITFADSTGEFAYYFEFAGNFYDTRAYNDNGFQIPGPLKLQPRESMCFYVLSQTPQQILQRWRTADPGVDALAGGGGETAVTAWIKKQLSVVSGGGAAVRTVQINRATGAQVMPTGVLSLVKPDAKTDENKVVKLWRVTLDRNSGENAATSNRPANDYLVDRLHDPNFGDTNQRAALYRRLGDDFNRFTSVPSGPEPTDAPYYTGPASQRDNFGHGITMYGTIRRRTDPLGGPMPGQPYDTTTGVMPAWCMEPKVGGPFEFSNNGTNSSNGNPPNGTLNGAVGGNVVDVNLQFTNSDVIPSGMGTSYFSDRNHPWAGERVHLMFQKSIANPYTTASRHPASRTGATPGGLGGAIDKITDVINTDLNNVGWIAGGKSSLLPVYPRRKTQVAADGTEVALQPLRPADLLMPWAIGPYSYGQIDAGFANDEIKHTTLSEAIAFGLNYSRAKGAANSESYEFQIPRVLDRCHIPLDRFVPFNDAGGAQGQWDYNQGDPDPSISNGIPFALNILDKFRTARYGTLDSIVPGQINLNTAPLSVLRMIPFLTPPSSDIYAPNDRQAFDGHWMTRTAGTGPFALKARRQNGQLDSRSLWDDRDAQGATFNNRWDVAATIAAYRDQQAVVARGAQGAETANGGNNGRVFVDFSRGTKTVTGNDGFLYFHGGTDKRPGRPFMTNVPNIRQEPGLQTPGEAMMAIVQDNTKRFATQNLNPDELKQLGMDRLETKLKADGSETMLTSFSAPVKPIQNVNALGLTSGSEQARQQAIGWTGLSAVRPPTTGTGPDTFVQAGRSSDYDRKLGIINALMNCTTTTSDVYCAYFLVRGYTEGDVQGLETYTGNTTPNEERYTRPMTPSVERRYMMVIDRSNCVRAGDKPKVLMFEELPVR